ncbi:MAG: TIGR00730 family Rossman fold protein [Firmicutes bacterium]|nr:TIGR00730 family Rossman fold protein [Bacillota bacterium]
MRICIYGAASDKIELKYLQDIENVGKTLAQKGHSLVFGGGDCGVMGAAAKGFSEGNGEIIGVITTYIHEYEKMYDACTENIIVETLAERKIIMEEKADVFFIAPGGIGTYDEFFQCLTLRELNRHDKPIIVYNAFGFYDGLLNFMNQRVEDQFIRPIVPSLYTVCNNLVEVLETLKKV